MKLNNLKEQVIDEFSSENIQKFYIKETKRGLWESESYFIKKYFKKKGAKVLDVGCGTGRTTMPLVKLGFKVIGIDVAPKMIENAKKIAKRNKLKIDYRVGDATELKLKNNNFDYALFSNQGWTHIPSSKMRIKALREIKRVLKKDGIFIFTAHQRVWMSKYFLNYLKYWIRFYILKKIGFKIEELDYGDIFFKKEKTSGITYRGKQYIHIVSKEEVQKHIEKIGLKLIECENVKNVSGKDSGNPVFFIVQKK